MSWTVTNGDTISFYLRRASLWLARIYRRCRVNLPSAWINQASGEKRLGFDKYGDSFGDTAHIDTDDVGTNLKTSIPSASQTRCHFLRHHGESRFGDAIF
ncbi:MAG: hypothetical protein GPOALKHO_001350 [Sodalis sp.]|nr:MAG: hypothetical protein GPOALKHO_001350 [Sodalis sp.]